MTIVDTYIDRAFSAKTDNRPEFQRMIKDSARGAFDIVLVWKLDRFARNRYDSAYYKNTLKKNGVRVMSVRETIVEGSEGILLEAVLEGYAEFFSAELAEKVTRGMKENALKGLWNGGNTPYGYIINAEHKLDIDPTAAPIVEEIFRMCCDGMTIKQITRVLSERKITRRNGKPLLYNAVRYILTNRVYIGEFNHMGVKIENGTPRIVSDELFNGARAEIAKNAHAPARHTAKDDYLLTTKLFCGKCGAMMVAQAGTSATNKTVYRYYECVRHKKHLCDKKNISKEKLENFVVQKTMEFLQRDEIVERLSEMLYKLQFTENTMLPRLEEQLKEKEKEIENILSAVQKGYAPDTLLKRLGELETQGDEIKESVAKERIKVPIFEIDHFKMAFLNFRKIDITKQAGKRKIIDAFINAIYLYDDSIKIVYNANGIEETISLDELESSNLISGSVPKIGKVRKNIADFYFFTLHLILHCDFYRFL